MPGGGLFSLDVRPGNNVDYFDYEWNAYQVNSNSICYAEVQVVVLRVIALLHNVCVSSSSSIYILDAPKC